MTRPALSWPLGTELTRAEEPMEAAFEAQRDIEATLRHVPRTLEFRRIAAGEVAGALDKGFAVGAGHRGGDGTVYGLAVREWSPPGSPLSALRASAATDFYAEARR